VVKILQCFGTFLICEIIPQLLKILDPPGKGVYHRESVMTERYPGALNGRKGIRLVQQPGCLSLTKGQLTGLAISRLRAAKLQYFSGNNMQGILFLCGS
jgi:hypothetical protein